MKMIAQKLNEKRNWTYKGNYMNSNCFSDELTLSDVLSDTQWEDMYRVLIDEGKAYNNFVNRIDIPKWADMDVGYKPILSEKIGNSNENIPIVVTYAPNSTLGIGYKRVFIVEKSTQKPFPRTREMWTELRNRSIAKQTNKVAPPPYVNIPVYNSFQKGRNIPDNITISENGELRNAFGVPKTNDLFDLVYEFCSIYNDWRKFPNETDYAVIETLKEAKAHVHNMQLHANGFEAEIEESRRIIKEQQDRIAELEKQMNKMYEEGANALNLLEEHGIQFDLNGEIQDDSSDISEMMPIINDIPGQYITYDSGSLLTIKYDTTNKSSRRTTR